LKKGFLGRKRQYDDEYEEAYCVLSVLKQKLKIYNKDFPAFKQIIPLKAAKIDDFKDIEFVINVELGKKLQFFAFRAKSEQEALEWVDFIKRAAFINSPNMIHVKIDPVNSTKVITFYILKNEKQEEMREERNENQVLREKKLSFNQSFTMRLVINNMIGISIIDSYPKEILSVTITNLIFAQTQTDDYDDTQDSSNVGNNANVATWTRTNVKTHMFS
jgi:vacuolar protein sorting-associated protein 13A/C